MAITKVNSDVADISNLSVSLANDAISGGVKSLIGAKQDSLVSGTNIKTINSVSLLGSGDLPLTAIGGVSSGKLFFIGG